MGEPIPGAEIYVELEPDDEPIANVISDDSGQFFINPVQNVPHPPKNSTVVFTITLPKGNKLFPKLIVIGQIKLPLKKLIDDRVFTYTLLWEEPDVKAQSKGAFAISGKSDMKQ
jgi:hypothetical protein